MRPVTEGEQAAPRPLTPETEKPKTQTPNPKTLKPKVDTPTPKAATPTSATTEAPKRTAPDAGAPQQGEPKSGRPAESATPSEPRTGGLGRWTSKLPGRTPRPAVQPAQAPARDVEISTSEPAAASGPTPADDTTEKQPPVDDQGKTPTAASSPDRPKATPLKRRPRDAEPATEATTAGSDPTTVKASDLAPNDAAQVDPAPATMQPNEVAPDAPVLPGRSSDTTATDLAIAAEEIGPQTPDSPPPMWQEPRRIEMDHKTKTSLLIAGIAGALLAVLAIGFAVYSVSSNNDVAGPAAGPSITASSAPKPAAAPLSDDFMLNDSDARVIDPKAGWKVSLTQEGTNAESPQPLCVRQNSEGLPTPLATKLRTLTTANDTSTVALHQADGYATADEAQQVFDDRLTQLGTCADSPVYLQSGIDIAGVGDQAGGIVAVLQGEKADYHSVVLTRTGKIVNIIDVAQTSKPAGIAEVGNAAAAIVDDECNSAVGLCSFDPTAKQGVPPIGGDQPGFLAGADLPRISKDTGDWSGTSPVTDITVVGSQCESTDFANVDGPTNRKARTYLLRNDDSAPTNFGIDEVTFTMDSPGEADDLVNKISGSVAKCPDRALTAKVKELPKIDGMGDRKIAVKGRSFLVTQKTQSGDVLFRIAMVSAGNKFAYLVMPTDPKFDFTDDQWTAAALRAGQRLSQVR